MKSNLKEDKNLSKAVLNCKYGKLFIIQNRSGPRTFSVADIISL